MQRKKAQAAARTELLSRQVFLGGLPAGATEEQIRGAIAAASSESCRLRLIRHRGQIRGFAFATFSSAEGAQRLISAGGLTCLGRTIDCRPAEWQAPGCAGLYTRKLYVGNLPSAATLEMLQQYFSAFGPVINVQLKLRRGRRASHRGFCFVTYRQLQDARTFLSTSHVLLGRVLRVAKAWFVVDRRKPLVACCAPSIPRETLVWTQLVWVPSTIYATSSPAGGWLAWVPVATAGHSSPV